MIKVLGISGSPRRGGNSELLLDSFLEGARSCGGSVKRIIINDLRFKPCQEYLACRTDGACILKDDMRLVYKLFDEADIVVISSPVYFGGITAQLKAMIDRFQPLWVKKEILKKPPLIPKDRRGVFLCVSASGKIEFFKHARKDVRILFSLLGIKYSGEIYCPGVEGKGDIKKKKRILSRSRLLGSRLVMER